MARQLGYITIECSICGHRSKADGPDLEGRIEDQLTFDTVGRIVQRLVCRSCRGRVIKVCDDAGRLIFDSANTVLCRTCGDPILLPRIEALPGTTLCACCAREATLGPRPEPYPQPPAGSTKCPRCGSPTIVRENSDDSSYFLGCTGFPACRWSSPFKHTKVE